MKKIKLLVMLIPLFLMSGCYNYRELNQLAIVSAIGVDKTEAGYRVVVQVMDTQKQGSDSNSSGSTPKFTIYTEEADNLQVAFRHIILESPRRLYVEHLDLMVISEELARDGIFPILDFFFRDTEVRKQFLMIVSKGKEAEDVLSTLTPVELLNAKNIRDSLSADSRYLGMSEKHDFEKLVGNFLNDKVELTLAGIEVIGDAEKGEEEDNLKDSRPNTKIKLTPATVFKGDKLLGFVNERQSLAISFVRNEIENTIVTHSCGENQKMAVEIIDNKTSISPSKNEPKITINVKNKSNINEITCQVDLQNPRVIKELEQAVEKEIQSIITSGIQEINEQYNSDIYGFRDVFYRANPEYYHKLIEEHPGDFLKALEVEVIVDTQLQSKGSAQKVIPHE